MTCQHGQDIPSLPEKRSYLLDLMDAQTFRWGRCVVQSMCEHGMQEWVQELADHGDLVVVDENEKFTMTHPVVVNLRVVKLPVVDPIN